MPEFTLNLVDKVGNSVAISNVKIFFLIKDNVKESDSSPFNKDKYSGVFPILNLKNN